MKTLATLSVLAAGLAMPAQSIAQDRIGTLARGTYQCGLPGDAAGKAWRADLAQDFVITSASRYESKEGAGTYLVIGKTVTFTRGPMKDMRMRRLASGILQELDGEGKLGRMRCSRVEK